MHTIEISQAERMKGQFYDFQRDHNLRPDEEAFLLFMLEREYHGKIYQGVLGPKWNVTIPGGSGVVARVTLELNDPKHKGENHWTVALDAPKSEQARKVLGIE